MHQVSAIAKSLPGVAGVVTISGFNLLTFQSVSYDGTAFIRLKPFEQRQDPAQTAQALQGALMGRLNYAIRDAAVLVLNPPPIRGIGTAGGFTFVLQDRTGADAARFNAVLQNLLAQARSQPEIGSVFSGFDMRVPQIQYDIDRDKVKTLGVELSDVFQALQALLGGYYINDFNLYGRTFRVIAQADAPYRAQPQDVGRFYVRSASGRMVPLSTVVESKPVNGPQYFERFNLYDAATVNGTVAPGYSTGQAMAAMERIAAKLPPGFSYSWSEASYQEQQTSGQTAWIFALSLAFVFLVLAALYESWTIPVAILLGVPFGVLGAFLGLWLRNFDNNVYTQVALIMLIGLAAKNAILIVQFARLARARGQAAVQAALDGARLRIRPILMTSFAFILGTLPLAVAFGAGAGARRSIGTAVVFGMLAATLIGMVFIPSFYVLLQRIGERRWPFVARTGRPGSGATREPAER